ncbi:NAD(P)-dependent dehydrogenase (short-subunit alcohol dehydrogenase family) [Prauserella shujinwangii]|uniref:NAD(P)-dependent dehydrogenase (Short-subunit alcohol dehydrogenase family) n=1 Tax=Prauserella shujinwangii TaxID=1453103 RepID=A0A2T0LSJ7_9PSEU|nr:SDR family NAD(P)-dependent oxidoreductase [Prauserella shujinwangii]PRX46649.1 NAD(P)-dependent dehydrogenase (short-subunit alcohol dehydrogenase family) [Prauserella shujinwangii]
MTGERRPLTGATPIGDWLAHPEGGPLIRNLLAESGFDESVLAPVRLLPLRQLVTLSRGALTEEVVDDLVARANGGETPAEEDTGTGWQERIVPGRFADRTVIVTGAASGIGRATASRVAREGGRVVAVDLVAEGLDTLAAELDSSDVVPVPADVTKQADIERVVAAAGDRVDGLANVAGVVDDFTPVHEVSDAMWQRVFAVNVDGLFRLTRAVVPVMLSAGSGSIVNIASESALRGSAAGVAYTASKHAVVGITRSAAFMYGPGIRVNAVAPGGVATGMAAGEMSEFGRRRTADFLTLMPPIATAAQLAASITFLLSDDGVNVSGAVLPSDGGWSVQ